MAEKKRIGISACLIGMKYRFDGKHKMHQELINALSEHYDFFPICPEMEAGLSVPRETTDLHLEGSGKLRIIGNDSKTDYTEQICDWCYMKLEQLENKKLCGFIFKSKSPCCALKTAKIYRDGKLVSDKGFGLFAEMYRRRFFSNPCVEEHDYKKFLEILEK